jgi:hypothetical protein
MTESASGRRSKHVQRLGALAASIGLIAQFGCYSYTPQYGRAPAPGGQVRVSLSDAGRAMLSDQLGESIDWVQGDLAAADSTQMTVDVKLTRSLRGSYATWFGDRVQIPTRGVAQVSNREFSRGRSWFLAAGLTGGLVVLSRVLNLRVFGDGKDIPGDGCEPTCSEQ